MRQSKGFIVASLSVPLLLYVGFFVYPALQGFYVSLFNWDGFSTNMAFRGLGNFRELLGDGHFWRVVMRNTLGILVIGGAAVLGIALLFSHLLTGRVRGKRFLRAAVFFPNVVNPVALAVLWGFIYNQQWGLLNGLLRSVGLDSLIRTWTAPDSLFWALLAALVWINVGFYTVILVAALDRIPPDYADAANVDGATPWQVFFRIKLPLIRDILSLAIVLWGFTAIKEFSFLYAWGGGGAFPQPGQQNLAVYMYAISFGTREATFRMGYASAMGVLMLFIVFFFVFAFWKLLGRESVEY
ncbi:carbohydrate ABC transporter permease [Limnochorda pilosa]|uniref:carbohydrate ABC transporter permease n=1 Tax=Limnochorda pilosa TaxID=1555112 RepID=UPI0008367BDE|nr:sugar ABC transporter permease [Limnochorda pilosa]